MEDTHKGKLALIGVGRWGAAHLRTLQKLDVLRIVCDRDETALAEKLQSCAGLVSAVNDPAKVFSDLTLCAVAIVTPAATHYELVKRSLLAGLHVFVEKPLALRLEQGAELVKLAEERSLVLTVGHILLHDPRVRRLLDTVRRNFLGELRHVQCTRLNFGTLRTEESALWSLAVHDVSVCLAMMRDRGDSLLSVTCRGVRVLSDEKGGVDDRSRLELEFSGGWAASITVGWLHPHQHREMVVIGSKAMLTYNPCLPAAEQLQMTSFEVERQRGSKPAKLVHGKASLHLDGEPENADDALTCEYRDFLRYCAGELDPPHSNAREALDVLRVLEAAERSRAESGRRVSVDWTEERPPLAAPRYYAHPTAVIDDGAVIGDGCRIWHFSHVMSGAVLGEKCKLGQNVFVASSARLGSNVKVQNNVSVYDGVSCGDDVFIGPSVVFTNVKNPRSAIDRRGEYVKTVVERGVTIGANATILCGVTLAENCFVGAGAVVTHNVARSKMVYGVPARVVSDVSAEGYRDDEDKREERIPDDTARNLA